MASHSSATTREQAPHAPHATHATHASQTPYAKRTTRTATLMDALTRRAQSVLNDISIDAQDRAIIRYALETHDPWLAELVRRADAAETIVDESGFLKTGGNDRPHTNGVESSEDRQADSREHKEDDSGADKIEALAELICRGGDEPGTKAAALLVLMATLEESPHPKALANLAKHVAFRCCGELNLNGMVEAQTAMLESDLLARDRLLY